MTTIPLLKPLSALTALLVLLFQLTFPTSTFTITDWNGENQYYGRINNKPIVIYLESDKDTNGKIKIIFKDDKNKGTTIVFERELGGELSKTDQQYIEKILSNIEKFHKDNRTYNKIRDNIDSFWKGLKRNGNR